MEKDFKTTGYYGPEWANGPVLKEAFGEWEEKEALKLEVSLDLVLQAVEPHCSFEAEEWQYIYIYFTLAFTPWTIW